MEKSLKGSAQEEKPSSNGEEYELLYFQRLLTLNAFRVFLDEVLKHPYLPNKIPPAQIIARHSFVIHPTGSEIALFSNDQSLLVEVAMVTFSKKNLSPDQEKKFSSLLGQRTVLSRRMMSLEERIKSIDKNSNPKSLSRKDQADLRSLKSELETLNQKLTQLDQTILGYFDGSLVWKFIEDSSFPRNGKIIYPDLLRYEVVRLGNIKEAINEEGLKEKGQVGKGKEYASHRSEVPLSQKNENIGPTRMPQEIVNLILAFYLAACQADKLQPPRTNVVLERPQATAPPFTPTPTPRPATPTPTSLPSPTPIPEIVYGPTEEGFEQAKVIDYFTSYQVPASGILGFPLTHRFLVQAYHEGSGIKLSPENSVYFPANAPIQGGRSLEGRVNVFLPEDYEVRDLDGRKYLVFYYKNVAGKTEAVKVELGPNKFVMMIPSDNGLQPHFVEDFNIRDFESLWKKIKESQQRPQVSMIFVRLKDGTYQLVQVALLTKVPEFGLYDLLVWKQIINPNGCSDTQKQEAYENAIIGTFLDLMQKKDDPITQKKLQVLTGLYQITGDVKPYPEVRLVIRREAALYLLPNDITPSQFFAEELVEDPRLKELFPAEDDNWEAFLIKSNKKAGPFENTFDYLDIFSNPRTKDKFRKKLFVYLSNELINFLGLNVPPESVQLINFVMQ